MSRKALPIGTIVVILIVALAAMGAAYGLWSQVLTIRGTVETGEVDAELSLEEIDLVALEPWGNSFNDIAPQYCTGYTIGQNCDGKDGLNDSFQVEDKPVASCFGEFIDAWNMRITVANAYPGVNCFVRYNVENTGTIPVRLYGPDFFYDIDGDGDYDFMGTNGIGTIETSALHVNDWPPDCFADGVQLHAGEIEYCNLHINVKQTAEEGASYTFLVRFFARQWNEFALPTWRP
jgi:hypothetical protein